MKQKVKVETKVKAKLAGWSFITGFSLCCAVTVTLTRTLTYASAAVVRVRTRGEERLVVRVALSSRSTQACNSSCRVQG